jgi:hypothetical protein
MMTMKTDNIRFGITQSGAPTTVILSWAEILENPHPTLLRAERMQPYNEQTKDGHPLYENDILSLKLKDLDRSDGFFDSGIGEKAIDIGVDDIQLHLSFEDHEPMTAILYLLKNGSPVTGHEFYEVEPSSNSEPEVWRETGASMLFVRYLLQKGAKLIGNSWSHPHLTDAYKIR